MRTVWKYDLPLLDRVNVEMPNGAEIIHVATQHPEFAGTIQMWAGINPDAPPVTRSFAIVGTGNPIPDMDVWHVGSTIQASGQLVWHVFEILGELPA